MFVNFSNHPVNNWNEAQLSAARAYGEIAEVPFPVVPPMATEEEVMKIAKESAERIQKLEPDVVMCQGEFTVAFAVVNILKEQGVTCVSACSDRRTIETVLEDGTIKKESVFSFCRFRKYC